MIHPSLLHVEVMDLESKDVEDVKKATTSSWSNFNVHQMLHQLEKLSVPHFRRLMTRWMVEHKSGGWKLDIPAQFIKEHGDKFQEIVLLKVREHPRACAVKVRISREHTRQKVLFGRGWREFVMENGVEVGDELIFCVVAMSKFVVYIFCHNGTPKKKRVDSPVNEGLDVGAKVVESNGDADDIIYSSTKTSPVQIIKRPGRLSKYMLPNDVVYPENTKDIFSPHLKHKVDSLLTGFQCPHFVKKIQHVNVQSGRSVILSFPAEFSRRYGNYVLGFTNRLQGPDGQVTEVKSIGKMLKPYGAFEISFSTGWRAFSVKYELRLADVVVFSLTAPGFWIVQLVDRGSSPN